MKSDPPKRSVLAGTKVYGSRTADLGVVFNKSQLSNKSELTLLVNREPIVKVALF